MSLKKLFSCALLALHALDVIASPVDKTAGNLVRTPAGLVPRSNVHAVPKGAKVHQTPTEIQVIGSNGTILHSAPYDKSPKATVNPLRRPTNGSFANPRALPDGYVAYAYWPNPSSSVISNFVTVWTVPPVPSNVDGQLLYWFNALIPPSDDAILQPVLQFGVSPAGGGPYYSIASWYLLQGHVYFSELVENVAPGQELAGYMILANTMTSGSTTQYVWAAYFGGYRDTILTTETTEQLNWAYEALEIYHAQSASDLPPGNTDMTDIQVILQNGQNPSSLPWTTVSTPVAGTSMTILSNSAANGALRITY